MLKKLIISLLIIYLVCLKIAVPTHAFKWGSTPENGIYILPGGFHTDEIEKYVNFKFIGVSYKKYYIASFENSFGLQTTTIGINKNFKKKKKLSIGYTAGLLYGYKGKLSKVRGIPFKNTFLFKGDINPVIGLSLSYKINNKLEFISLIEPLVIIYGFKFLH